MKKNYVFILVLIIVYSLQSQILSPDASNDSELGLDLKGSLRIGELKEGSSLDDLVTVNKQGDLRRLKKSSPSFYLDQNLLFEQVLGYLPDSKDKRKQLTTYLNHKVTELGCKQYPVNKHWYCAYQFDVKDGLTWPEAFNFGKEVGGYLSTLTSMEETNWFNENILGANQGYNLANNIWIGYSMVMKPGNIKSYQWITGEESKIDWAADPPVTEHFFQTGQPDHYDRSPEHSIHISGVGSFCKDRRWNDFIGGLREIPHPNSYCGLIDSGNQYFRQLVIEFNE